MPDSAPLPAAKLMPKVEELWVTTEPFPASRKVHAPGRLHPGISVGMREIDLDPSAGEPPVRTYDTSGPYSDPTIQIDINRGPPKLRKPWILARADVELYEGREVKPEDNGLRRGEASAVSPFDRGRRQVLRAKGGAAVTQLAYGGDKAPERNDQFGCQRHDHCLACATTAIGGAGAIQQYQSALILKCQKTPGKLDHAAADPGVAGSGEPLLAPLRAARARR